MCQDCNETSPFVVYESQYSASNCDSCPDPECGSTVVNSKCVYYTGADLPCSGITSGNSIEAAIQKIDTQICSVIGDYSTYNTYCLAPVNTQQEFVEKISAGYCTLLNDFNQFITNTFPYYQAAISTQFYNIQYPQIVCQGAGVQATDSLNSILNNYCFAISNMQYFTYIADVDWSRCFTVVSPPTNLSEAFTVVLDQICSVASGSGTLPVFNNIGSCLPNPGASDSLVSTIDKIKTRLCQTGTFDVNSIVWGCFPAFPTDLQSTIQQLVDYVNIGIQNTVTWSADFVVTQTNLSDVCNGITVSLATPIVNNDRLVASNNADTSPGTLMDKLLPGTNISLDDTTTPGTVIINATAIADTYQVKANVADDSPNYLDLKVNGVTNTAQGIAIGTAYNSVTKQVDFTPGIDWTTFTNAFLVQIQNNTALRVAFCNLVNTCVVVPTCNSYTVSLTPAQISSSISVQFNYLNCSNVVEVVTLVPVSLETVSFCALTGSVNAPGLLVLDAGLCGVTPPDPGSLTGYAINYGSTPTLACAGGSGTETVYSTDPQFGVTVGLVNGQTYYYSDGSLFNGIAHAYWADATGCRYGTINSSGVFIQLGLCAAVGGCGI